MANSNPSFLGQINQTGAQDALFLKLFANEVLAAFNTNCLYHEKTFTREISQGKSAQFPAMGRIGAEYHTPGHQLLGLKMGHAERVITIDGMLVSHAFIAEIDELRNHYDIRSQYSRQLGQALAEIYDKHVASTIYQAARSGPTITGEKGGRMPPLSKRPCLPVHRFWMRTMCQVPTVMPLFPQRFTIWQHSLPSLSTRIGMVTVQ